MDHLVDFPGSTYELLDGTGFGYNVNYAPVSIGPDRAAYVGVLGRAGQDHRLHRLRRCSQGAMACPALPSAPV